MNVFRPTLKSLSRKKFRQFDKTPFVEKWEFLGRKLINFLKGAKSCIFILPVTVFLFFLSSFNWDITWLFFYKTGEIYFFLENWVAYFIGLFGVVIAVGIFVISGIQSKNQTEEQLSIIFRESLLFPLIYFSLTVIGIMVFVSFRPLFLTELQIGRITILGLSLFIIELILIAYLFSRAFKFIDPSTLIKKYSDDLKSALRKELKDEFISKISEITFEEEIQKFQIEPNILRFQPANYKEVKIELKQKMVVEDFNITKLTKWLNEAPLEIKGTYYLPISIKQFLPQQLPILWIKGEELYDYFNDKDLSKLLKVSRVETGLSEVEKLKQKMKNRLLTSIKNNDLESFYTILDMYNFIVMQFAEMYEYLNIFDSGVELNSTYVFRSRYSWNILYRLDADFRNGFILSVDSKNREVNKELIDQVFAIFVLSIKRKNLTLIHLFKNLPGLFLKLSNKKEDFDLSHNKYFYMRLKEIIGLTATIECEKVEQLRDKEIIYAIITILFNEYVEIIKYLMTLKKSTAFELAWEQYSQFELLFKTFEEKAFTELSYPADRLPENYYKGNTFALWSWLILLYKNDKVSKDVFIKIEKGFGIQNIDLNIIFELYLLQRDNKCFWEEWELNEQKQMKAYWKLSTEDWLLYAAVLFMLKYKQSYAFTFENFTVRADWYSQNINSIFKDILDHYSSKWVTLFENQEVSKIKESIQNLSDKVKGYKEQYEYQKMQEVIEKSISNNAVNKFRSANCKRWKETNPIYKLFDRYNKLEMISNSQQLPKVSRNYNIMEGKKWFVYEDEYYVQVATEFGFNHNQLEKNKFIRTLIQNRIDKERKFPNLETCFETLIAEFQQNNIEPNLIICSRLKVLQDRELKSSPKFTRSTLIGHTNDRQDMDQYGGVPIYYFEDKTMPYVIMSKFEKSFSMRVYKTEEKYESIFQLNVNSFTKEEADNFISQHSETWTLDANKKTISEIEAREKILSSIKIEVFSNVDFIIEDANNYRVGQIEESEDNEDTNLEKSA